MPQSCELLLYGRISRDKQFFLQKINGQKRRRITDLLPELRRPGLQRDELGGRPNPQSGRHSYLWRLLGPSSVLPQGADLGEEGDQLRRGLRGLDLYKTEGRERNYIQALVSPKQKLRRVILRTLGSNFAQGILKITESLVCPYYR